jgi:nicotinamide phosphoribosyltransferase
MKFIDDIGTLLTQPLFNTDTYKATHHSFAPPGLEYGHDYIEARKGGQFKEVQFFGLTYALRYYMSQRMDHAMVDEAVHDYRMHGVEIDETGFRRVVDVHGGYAPVRVSAVPEGIILPQGTPQVTVESTDPQLAGLRSFYETMLLRGVHYTSTIATRSMRWWRIIHQYLEESGDPTTTDMKMVDFGARGAHATESAGTGGMAHLVNFQVSDNQMGIRFARHAYRMNGMPAFSVPASEHSITTSWGIGLGHELELCRQALVVFGSRPNPVTGGRNLASIVNDTTDQDEHIKMWGTTLKQELIDSHMTLITRPDSGDPVINVIHVLDLLGHYFGFTVNEKGYRVLPEYVRVIQGDGINEDTLRRILQRMVWLKWSVDNLVFGSGGGLLVHEAERDTHRYAMKASEVVVNGERREIQKTVKTDPSKASKRGRFAVLDPCDGTNRYETIAEHDLEPGMFNLLQPVWENGTLIDPPTFLDVRERAAAARLREPIER